MAYKVLLVDDEPASIKGLETFVAWSDYGFEVIGSANSVAQALVFLEGNPIDLVVTDIRMPVQSGIDLLEILKDEYPKVKAFVLSAHSEFQYAQQAMRYSAVDYLTKPVDFDEIHQLLKTLKSELDHELFLSNGTTVYTEEELLLQLLTGQLDHVHFPTLSLCPTTDAFYVALIQWRQGEMAPIVAACHQALQTLGDVQTVLMAPEELAVLLVPNKADLSDWKKAMYAIAANPELRESQLIIGASNICIGADTAYIQAVIILEINASFPSDDNEVFFFFSTEFDGPQTTDAYSAPQLEILNILGSKRFSDILNAATSDLEEIEQLRHARVITIQLLMEMEKNYRPTEDETHSEVFRKSIEGISIAQNVGAIKQSLLNYIVSLLKLQKEHNSLHEDQSIIEKVMLYIDENYAKKIDLQTLADLFYLHPVYLSRLFKEETGINFIHYITDVRLKAATEFLMTTTYPVGDVGAMVGYENPQYFSKLFKSHFDITPKQYREKFSHALP